jgi:hypothetical protein
MKISDLALMSVLAVMSCGALAKGSGTLVIHGKTAKIQDAIAYQHPASYDVATTMTTIVFSDKAIDAKKVKASNDPDGTVHTLLQESHATYAEVTLYPDGQVWTGAFVWPGIVSLLGTTATLNLTRRDAKRLEGWYFTRDENEKQNLESGVYSDIEFAVDLLARKQH